MFAQAQSLYRVVEFNVSLIEFNVSLIESSLRHKACTVWWTSMFHSLSSMFHSLNVCLSTKPLPGDEVQCLSLIEFNASLIERLLRQKACIG